MARSWWDLWSNLSFWGLVKQRTLKNLPKRVVKCFTTNGNSPLGPVSGSTTVRLVNGEKSFSVAAVFISCRLPLKKYRLSTKSWKNFSNPLAFSSSVHLSGWRCHLNMQSLPESHYCWMSLRGWLCLLPQRIWQAPSSVQRPLKKLSTREPARFLFSFSGRPATPHNQACNPRGGRDSQFGNRWFTQIDNTSFSNTRFSSTWGVYFAYWIAPCCRTQVTAAITFSSSGWLDASQFWVW